MKTDLMEMVEEYLYEKGMGEENAVKSRELEILFNIKSREVREIINIARRNQTPIGSGGKGYYICKDKRELRKVVNSMYKRMEGILGALEGLEDSERELI